jgi:glutamate dehydrogenase (NADP+)
MQNMLARKGGSVEGKTACVSGSGNVAIYCIEKLIQLGAKVVTASDSSGFVHDPAGFDEEKLAFLKEIKEVRRGRIAEYAERFGCNFHADSRPWHVPCDLAFPCATQNELHLEDAQTLIENGVEAVAEGANQMEAPSLTSMRRRQENPHVCSASSPDR